jgi:hypothetical protein
LKRKNLFLILFVFICIIAVGFFTTEDVIKYSQYATVTVDKNLVDIGRLQINHEKKILFKIKNNSKIPFILIDGKTTNQNLNITLNNKTVIVRPTKTLLFVVKIKAFKLGIFEEKIMLESNSQNPIVLKLRGTVYETN